MNMTKTLWKRVVRLEQATRKKGPCQNEFNLLSQALKEYEDAMKGLSAAEQVRIIQEYVSELVAEEQIV
jgi:hypothetical protein